MSLEAEALFLPLLGRLETDMEILYTLVTGAAGGLGGAFVKELARRSQPLYLTGRSAEKLNALREQLLHSHPSLPVRTAVCDLADDGSRRALFAEFERENVRFCRLVYAAGADIQKPLEEYTEEKIAFQARANFEGAVSLARAVLERGEGVPELLFVGSVSGLYPMPYFALYSATKKALWQFAAALRTELHGRAKVTCVQPGAIPTREDVKENIRTQGLWGKLAALPPDVVARKSLNAVRKNRRSPVLGFWNKLMHGSTALLPLSWKMHFIAKKWSKTRKDAF